MVVFTAVKTAERAWVCVSLRRLLRLFEVGGEASLAGKILFSPSERTWKHWLDTFVESRRKSEVWRRWLKSQPLWRT